MDTDLTFHVLQVVIFKIQEGDVGATPMVLQELGKWNHNYFVTNLAFDGERILVGDAISSVSAIRWNEEGQTVQTVARDYGPLWPVAIESTGNGIIGANVRRARVAPMGIAR